MRRLSIVAVGVLVLAVFAAGSTADARPTFRAPWIGASTIELTQADILYDNVLQKWIPTGSSSSVCLVTLADESVTALFNAHPAITTVCSGRDTDGGGVILTVWVGSDPLPTDTGFVIDLTVYQQGALGYPAS